MGEKIETDTQVAIKGGIWTTISTLVTMSTQLLRLAILTRYLDKEDFGVVSITNTVILLCVTFTDLGFASVIMYKCKLSKKEFSSLFWLQFILFSVVYAILYLCSSVIASYYDEDILSDLIIISGISLFAQAIGKLYDSILLKTYQFRTLAIRNIITSVISLFVAWWSAYKGLGAYSLVYSTLVQLILINVWNMLSGYRIQPLSLSLDVRNTMPLVKIGVFQTGTNILDFISNKLDVVIIGRVLGMDILGIYDLAKELVLKFVYLIRTVVAKVALPLLTNNNNDDEVVKRRFLSVTKLVAHICIPICITLAVFSEEVVRILYGNEFREAIPIVSIFALLTIASSIAGFFDMLGVAKGRTDLNFFQTCCRILLTTPVIMATCYWGILAVAYGQLFIGLISIMLFWHIVVSHTYPISIKTYFSQFARILIGISLVGLFISIIKHLDIIQISCSWYWKSSIYVLLYIVTLFLVSPFFGKEYKYYISLIIRK